MREEFLVTNKVERSLLEADKLYLSVESSLIKLELEYIDLFLIHWPNPQVLLDQTIESMLIIKEQGNVANIGVSNFPLSLLKQAREEYLAPVFCNQVEYDPLLGQFDLLDYALEHDLMITAFSPLAQGRLINNPVLEEIPEISCTSCLEMVT